MVSIRPAQRSDAQALAELAEYTFREAFGTMNTAADMAMHCLQSYGETIQAAEIAANDRLTLLAEVNHELAGFTQLRWGAAPTCVSAEAPGEILRFYLRSEFHGAGVATTLMDTALAALRERGAKTAWLGVWEQNPRAIAFYRKRGFAEVGAQTFVLGTDRQRDKVFARSL
ncbi:MAG: GNAT family N-acetyltransferase [Sinobacteraceae bacterium]|nr:GNAT family N-acetyltransferase [Nevskiaceae bacterium]